jgi:AcrR family transcriptional regulator
MSTTSAVRPGPRESRARRRLIQDEIVRAAAVCFREHGYRATTLDAIAARAGVSKVTLYKYVSSKEELLCQVFERTIDSFRAGLRRIVEPELPADETLRRILRYQVELLASHLPFLTVFFSEEGGLPPEMARRVAREKREYDRAIERVVRAGVRQGLLRELPPTLLVFALLGMCNWLHKWYRPEGELAPGEIAAFFVDLAEHGYLRQGQKPGAESIARALQGVEGRLARLERTVRRRKAV